MSLIQGIIKDTGIDAAGLELEVTERILMADSERCISTLTKLKEFGINAALDDFGTGTSSLSYLKRLPISVIKIDKSFVADLATSIDDLAIVKTILTLAQTLGQKVVAEGVETEAQLSILRAHGCDEAQGYLFARPMPANETVDFISSFKGSNNLEFIK